MKLSSFGREYFDKAYGQDHERRNPPRKLDYYLGRIRKAKPAGNLLDVGCAYGLFLSRANRFYDVTGCDVSDHAVRAARERLPGLRVFRSGIEELSLDSEFDVITCFDVLEHVADLASALASLSRLLKHDGVLVVTVPVYDGLPGWIVRSLDRDDTHVWRKSRGFWRDTLRAHGFRIIDDVGLWRYFLFDRRYIFFGGRAFRNFSPALLLMGMKP